MRNTGARDTQSLPAITASSHCVAGIVPRGSAVASAGITTLERLPSSCSVVRATLSSGLTRPSCIIGIPPAVCQSKASAAGRRGVARGRTIAATSPKASRGARSGARTGGSHRPAAVVAGAERAAAARRSGRRRSRRERLAVSAFTAPAAVVPACRDSRSWRSANRRKVPPKWNSMPQKASTQAT